MRFRTTLPLTMLALATVLSLNVSADDTKPSPPAGGKAMAVAPAAAKAPGTKSSSASSDNAIKAIDAQIVKAKVSKSNAGWRTALPMPTVVVFDPAKQYFVTMTTNKGAVKIKFLPEIAPMHVTNFIYLTRLGFYDGLAFHRVITHFMAQGGCPLGNGMGSPGYGFNGEFSPKARHTRPGLLSMANTGQPNSDGSQFFLTFVPTPWLDDKHTIFGEVVEGMDVLKALEAVGSSSGQTSERLMLEKATISVQ